MRLIRRGILNAFRNLIRTLSVTMILALSIGLALIMLLSYQTVQNRIASVKATVGNTITVHPAGAQGFQGGGEPLTDEQMDTIRSIEHVTTVVATLQDRLVPTTDTNLASAIEPGTIGKRAGQQAQRQVFIMEKPGVTQSDSGMPSNQTFSIPIMINATSNPGSLLNNDAKLTAGSLFAADSTENVAVVGTSLATKNNLNVGSTFTAYSGKTITVVGIYDAGNEFANSGMAMPIKTLQTLSDQVGSVSNATVTADTIENVDGIVSAIQSKIGTDKVDVTSNKEAAEASLTPLKNIASITFSSLIGALIAGSIITLLIMMMIVRERRREIGVLKAIGSSNIGIVMQFVTESLVLTFIGSIIGIIIGLTLSNPVLDALVKNSSSDGVPSLSMGGPSGGTGFTKAVRVGGLVGEGIRSTVSDLHATTGLNLVFYGLLTAVAITILGSAIPAWLIAKVKPAEVMRAE
jgi:putative ABC transport system permease protein